MNYLGRPVMSVARGAASIVRQRASRWTAALATCTAVLSVTACGGGAYADSDGNFNIGVTVAGLFTGYTPVASGDSMRLTVRTGQPVTFDAGEPAIWTMYVGGSAIASGVQVYYAGANIWATALDRSRVAVSTYAPFALPASIPITLVATSEYDSAQVATVHLLITN